MDYRPRILIVDDEDNVRHALKRTLGRSNMKIQDANSGKQALAMMASDDFNLVIADLRMPDMDGLDFLSVASELHPHTSQILISGNADKTDLSNALNRGNIEYFVEKPWSQEGFVAAAKRIITANVRERSKEEDIQLMKQRVLQLNDLVECFPGSLFIWDEDTRLVLSNATADLVSHDANVINLGEKFQDVIRKFVNNGLIPVDSHERESYIQECLQMFNERSGVFEQKWSKDRYFAVYHRDTGIGGTVSFYLDITDRKLIEEKLSHSLRMQALRTLTNGFAHNFNNILTPVLGYSELLMERTRRSNKNYDYARSIFESAVRAKNVIYQTQLFSRRSHISKKTTDLAELAQGVVRLIKQRFRKTTTIHPKISSQPLLVVCDVPQIHRVLMNLCINAEQAILETGTITLTLEPDQLDDFQCIGRALNGKYIRVAVTDNGLGIDKSTLEHIFEPFFTTREVGGGLGLGLSAALGVLDDHEGGISVSTTPGRGSTFEFFLPDVEGRTG